MCFWPSLFLTFLIFDIPYFWHTLFKCLLRFLLYSLTFYNIRIAPGKTNFFVTARVNKGNSFTTPFWLRWQNYIWQQIDVEDYNLTRPQLELEALLRRIVSAVPPVRSECSCCRVYGPVRSRSCRLNTLWGSKPWRILIPLNLYLSAVAQSFIHWPGSRGARLMMGEGDENCVNTVYLI